METSYQHFLAVGSDPIEPGLTQTELAKRMKVSHPYVTKILSGDVNITFGSALRLACALEMDLMPDLRERD